MSADECVVAWPVRRLVEDMLAAVFVPYPPDIVDRVCLAKEADPGRLRRYHAAAAESGDGVHSAECKVNNAIGWWVKDLTGMVSVRMGSKRPMD